MNPTVGFPLLKPPSPPCQEHPQLLHPLHGGTGRAVPPCVTKGGAEGTRVVNKGLFSPEWGTVAGASCRTGGCFRGRPRNVRVSVVTCGGFLTLRGDSCPGRGGCEAHGWDLGTAVSLGRDSPDTGCLEPAGRVGRVTSQVSWVGDHQLVPVVLPPQVTANFMHKEAWHPPSSLPLKSTPW